MKVGKSFLPGKLLRLFVAPSRSAVAEQVAKLIFRDMVRVKVLDHMIDLA
jgi:hypothetical protein